MPSFLKRFIWLHFAFSGRANRTHMWIYMVSAPVIVAGIGLVGGLITAVFSSAGEDAFLISSILAAIWTALAIVVKRSHDLGKGTLFITGAFIPVINIFVTNFCLAMAGEENVNSHGPPSAGFDGRV